MPVLCLSAACVSVARGTAVAKTVMSRHGSTTNTSRTLIAVIGPKMTFPGRVQNSSFETFRVFENQEVAQGPTDTEIFRSISSTPGSTLNIKRLYSYIIIVKCVWGASGLLMIDWFLLETHIGLLRISDYKSSTFF